MAALSTPADMKEFLGVDHVCCIPLLSLHTNRYLPTVTSTGTRQPADVNRYTSTAKHQRLHANHHYTPTVTRQPPLHTIRYMPTTVTHQPLHATYCNQVEAGANRNMKPPLSHFLFLFFCGQVRNGSAISCYGRHEGVPRCLSRLLQPSARGD